MITPTRGFESGRVESLNIKSTEKLSFEGVLKVVRDESVLPSWFDHSEYVDIRDGAKALVGWASTWMRPKHDIPDEAKYEITFTIEDPNMIRIRASWWEYKLVEDKKDVG